jgi:hypothetical protein
VEVEQIQIPADESDQIHLLHPARYADAISTRDELREQQYD